MKTGIEIISAERERQMAPVAHWENPTGEGWTAEHDDSHTNGELLRAAICYLLHETYEAECCAGMWPWSVSWWNPSQDKIRNMAKAGALIAAEIDRLQRKESNL